MTLHPNLFSLHRMGRLDPCCELEKNQAWFAARTPDGPGTLRLWRRAEQWEADAWGPGGSRLLSLVPAVTGVKDTVDTFDPSASQRLRRLWRHHRLLRLSQAPSVFDAAIRIVLQQRVSWREATRSYRVMAQHFDAPAPGPGGLVLPPSPEHLLSLPVHAFHLFGVEQKRALTLQRLARLGHRLETLRDDKHNNTAARLNQLRGVGPWTRAMLAGLALGDADALPVGDYALPHTVSAFFHNQPRSDDHAMAKTLEPFRPHRFRVIRLLWAAGFGMERRGPRRTLPPLPYGPRSLL